MVAYEIKLPIQQTLFHMVLQFNHINLNLKAR